MIRVCIADDHELVRLGLRAALQSVEHVELVGEAQSGERLIELVDRVVPDIVLVEIHMPGLDGLTCMRMIKQRHPAIGVVMLSSSEHPGDISAALSGGASAYLNKRIRARDLVLTLLQVAQGDVVRLPQPAADEPAAETQQAILTERERGLLEALVRGLSTKAISAELWISERTVKFHLTNIYRKLGVHNRASAMRYAYEHGLLSPSREPAEARAAAL